MLTINLIREKRELIIERLKVKNFDAEKVLDKILSLDSTRREIQTRSDSLQAEMNRLSKDIGLLLKTGRKKEADEAKEKTYTLKEELRSLSEELTPLDIELRELIVSLPNLPHESVNKGFGAEDNFIVKEGGKIVDIDGEALPHWELI